MSPSTPHPSPATLQAYWLHDTDEATTEAVDVHLLQCEACGQALDALIALGQGVHDAFRAGAVTAVTGGAFVQGLAEQGLRLREYRLPHNGSVNCTVAPDDELLVTRLEAPLQGVQRLDLRSERSIEPGAVHTVQDIPFDALAGEVVFTPRLDAVRPLPAHTMWVTLLSVEPGGPRELGRYTFHHRPWPGE